MRPKELIFAPLADQDLLDIFLYIAADDPIAAGHFVRDLTRKIEWIAQTGFGGLPRDRISPGLMALPYRKRCIYFRTDETTVKVVRVLHGHRNISSEFFKTEKD